MPLTEDEWDEGLERSRSTPTETGAKRDILDFLRTHSESAFSLTEIAENAGLSLTTSNPDGIKETATNLVKGAVEERIVKHYLNQLVAEGHVDTRIIVENGNETVYYRIGQD